jgi:hypothetical protein
MPSFRPALCASLTAALLLAAPAAEARFGKKSADTSSRKDSKDDDRPAKVHTARPVQASDRRDTSEPAPRYTYTGPSTSERLYDVGNAIVATAELAALVAASSEPEDSPDAVELAGRAYQRARPVNPIDVRMGLNVGAMGGGTSGDVFLGFESQEMGFVIQGTQLTLPTDDGTPGTDEIRLVNVHITWSALSTERVRWRFEGGASTASAPDVFFVGPSLATSLELCLVGPLDLEARAQVTPAPYRQLDASVGLAAHLGALVVRGGLRGLILDDAGLVDGVQHVDRFVGPYAGAGFVF